MWKASWSRDFDGFPRSAARDSEMEEEGSQLLGLRLLVAAEYREPRQIG